MIKAVFYTIIISLFSITYAGQWSDTRRGIKNFRDGDYDEAMKNFQRAKDAASDNPLAMYNLGTALYKNGKIGEAAKEFSNALMQDTMITDTILTKNLLYNIGNCAYLADSFRQAARFYKSAVILDPNDEDAKYNLELALRHLQNQQNQQNQNQNQQKNQQQQQQNQQNQQQNQQQQQQNQQKQQQQNQQQQQAQKQKKKQGELSKEEAERLMEAMERQEKELLKDWMKDKNKKRASGGRYRNPRDW